MCYIVAKDSAENAAGNSLYLSNAYTELGHPEFQLSMIILIELLIWLVYAFWRLLSRLIKLIKIILIKYNDAVIDIIFFINFISFEAYNFHLSSLNARILTIK